MEKSYYHTLSEIFMEKLKTFEKRFDLSRSDEKYELR